MANFDFYSTIAALAGQPIPEHCDGVDLFPYLKGEQTADAHEYLFWLNNEPGDAIRRHLIAVRWKDWRLYMKYEKDQWQLFDLKSDPREESDLAAKHLACRQANGREARRVGEDTGPARQGSGDWFRNAACPHRSRLGVCICE